MTQSTFFETENEEPVQGITQIAVCGYKSIYEECQIEVRSLTILAGANSSGKSSIMQPLLLMKQTLEAPYDPGGLKLDGPNVKFTSAEQILSKLSPEKYRDEFSVRLNIDNDNFLINLFRKQPKHGIKVFRATYCIPNYNSGETITIFPGMQHQELVKILPEYYAQYYNLLYDNIEIKSAGVSVSNVRCFLDLQFGDSLFDSPYSANFSKHIRRIVHVPGLRGNPERTYNTAGVSSEFPGLFENYLASIVNYWQETKDDRLSELGQALEFLGLNWKVEARQINDVQIELRVGRLSRSGSASDTVSIADVGLGVSQTLPVLVALLVAEPGQLVYLEQPEIHLHPRAQVALAQILVDSANRGVRVVIETHSELLLLAVQSLVAEGKILPDLVKLHWFKRRDDGVTEVSSADLDETGAFGDWPEDLGDVSLHLENRYLDAAEAVLWKR
ncbi:MULTISPECIES: AAA family ATPase [unclassified Microcoleus]|uniref:AAA family ATPase n=1 Tax=unclassified Microcoleus TaxID=2642155 RepID=UPI002FD31229